MVNAVSPVVDLDCLEGQRKLNQKKTALIQVNVGYISGCHIILAMIPFIKISPTNCIFSGLTREPVCLVSMPAFCSKKLAIKKYFAQIFIMIDWTWQLNLELSLLNLVNTPNIINLSAISHN